MKYLFAVAAALGLAFVAYGAAATVNVNGGTIQHGEDNNVMCTEEANVQGWGLETDDNSVSFVRIGVNENCAGNDLFVSITEDGSEIASGSVQPIPVGGNCVSPTVQICVRVNFDPQDADDITDIHVWIEGPAGIPNQ